MRFSRLTRREEQVIRKFRMGYVAWCTPKQGIAYLIPGAGGCGREERVRRDTLSRLAASGYLNETQDGDEHSDINWRYRVQRPKVSDSMATVDGEVSETLRSMLEYDNCILRRPYDAVSLKPDKRWTILSVSCNDSVSVPHSVVQNWAKEYWVEWFGEIAILRRCHRCDCVGYYIDGDSRCEECAGIED